MRLIYRVERLLTGGLLGLSVLLLALILALYIGEIVLRYGFNAPTTWSADIIVYVLPAFVFFALPEVTRQGKHIAITFVVESVNARTADVFNRIIGLACAGLCGMAAWISATIVLRQAETGMLSDGVTQIPKWLISAPLPIGLGLMAFVFLTVALDPAHVADEAR